MSDIKIVGWPKRPAEQRRDELEIENAELKAANEALKVFISGQEAENAKLRNIILTIRVLEYDLHKMRGHECYAKHWALSLLDRVKRMNKGKED